MPRVARNTPEIDRTVLEAALRDMAKRPALIDVRSPDEPRQG